MAVLRTEIMRYLSAAALKKGLSIKVVYMLIHQAAFPLIKFTVSIVFEGLNPVIEGTLDTPVQFMVSSLSF